MGHVRTFNVTLMVVESLLFEDIKLRPKHIEPVLSMKLFQWLCMKLKSVTTQLQCTLNYATD